MVSTTHIQEVEQTKNKTFNIKIKCNFFHEKERKKKTYQPLKSS